jgi:hypothetical protein
MDNTEQVFAYTEPTPTEGYCQFLQIFQHGNGDMTFTVRSRTGECTSIRVPASDIDREQPECTSVCAAD